MININYGHNKGLLEACKPLGEYSYFVDRVRFHLAENQAKEEAVDAALNELPDDFVIKPYLLARRAEVKMTSITEYDEEKVHSDFFEDGVQQGIKQGIEQGIELGGIKMLVKGVSLGLLTISQAAGLAQTSESEFVAAAGL